MPMVRVNQQDYERLVRLRGEFESRTGKPLSLGETFAMALEASGETLRKRLEQLDLERK